MVSNIKLEDLVYIANMLFDQLDRLREQNKKLPDDLSAYFYDNVKYIDIGDEQDAEAYYVKVRTLVNRIEERFK